MLNTYFLYFIEFFKLIKYVFNAVNYRRIIIILVLYGYGSDISLNINAEIETTDKVLTVIDKVNSMVDKYKNIVDKIINKEYADAKDMITIVDTLVALQELNLN